MALALDPRYFSAREAFKDGFDSEKLEERMVEFPPGGCCEAAARITVPTLLVRGALSDLVTPEAAHELVQVMGGRLVCRRR